MFLFTDIVFVYLYVYVYMYASIHICIHVLMDGALAVDFRVLYLECLGDLVSTGQTCGVVELSMCAKGGYSVDLPSRLSMVLGA